MVPELSGGDGLHVGPAKILVRGTKIPEKFGPSAYYFQNILVSVWNNGPSANTSV